MTIVVTLNVLLVVVEISTKHNHVIVYIISYMYLMATVSQMGIIQCLINCNNNIIE